MGTARAGDGCARCFGPGHAWAAPAGARNEGGGTWAPRKSRRPSRSAGRRSIGFWKPDDPADGAGSKASICASPRRPTGRYVIFMPHAHVDIHYRSRSDTYGEVAERSKAAHFGAHTGRNTITRWHTS
jgi:hypothetical protein